tara:strand:+ start:217 stop:456 length:240 start_codon:yes stop_codon:yes gene_type:complete
MEIESFSQSLGQAFKQRRLVLQLTHEIVAEKSGMNVNYYARIERGEINTSLEKILAISSALDCAPSVLFVQAEKINSDM